MMFRRSEMPGPKNTTSASGGRCGSARLCFIERESGAFALFQKGDTPKQPGNDGRGGEKSAMRQAIEQGAGPIKAVDAKGHSTAAACS